MFGLDIYTLLVLWAATLSGTTIVGTGITWLVLQSKTRPTEQAKEQVKGADCALITRKGKSKHPTKEEKIKEIITGMLQQSAIMAQDANDNLKKALSHTESESNKFENARQNLTAKLPDGETLIVSTVGGRVEELSIKEDPKPKPTGWGTVYNAESTARRNTSFSRTRSKQMPEGYGLICQFGDEEFAEWFCPRFEAIVPMLNDIKSEDIKSLELLKVSRRNPDETYIDLQITPKRGFRVQKITINNFNTEQPNWMLVLKDAINNSTATLYP